MTLTKTDSQTRSHQHELEIDASQEDVWRALTEAEELVNWFPLEAETEPGEGGSITLGWGEGMRGTCEILVWDPPNHLRTSWLGGPAGEEARSLAVDWHLEGARGKTRLRLVHSGFGPDAEWDKEFDGTRRGWAFELRSLRHYLGRHRGKSRTAFWVRRSVDLQADEVWNRLIHPEGVIRGADFAALRPGDPVQFELASGDRVQGKLVLHQPPHDVACTVGNWSEGLLRAGFEDCMGGPEAHIWVSLWGYPKDRADALEKRLKEALAGAF